eukprot:TRINITY_DN58019_c0_g1_i1.p1 TRINITY_DN58019_c0_g1~~TRINITY_DN58019_c0_g1_i1.p1  ORF type:complete len:155 (-),score=11.99 TRINITY_DN58019_c0_g1_i1:295-759(-)
MGAGGMGGRVGLANVETNPHCRPPDPLDAAKTYEDGSLSFSAWESMLPSGIADGFRDTPGPWSTAVVLPLDADLVILEAWYGHPSDAGRRVDIKERVKKLLEGPKTLPGGLVYSSEGFFQNGKLYLSAETSLWGEDPARWTWKKLFVRFRKRYD